MRGGEIEETQIPRNPLDVLAQQIVAICRRRGDRGRRAARARAPRVPVRRPLAHAARERARHARRPLPVRRVRRAAAADRLGPHRRHDPRPRGRAPARGHERGHDPRPRHVRRLPGRRRRPRRRARRGDGLRGARGPDVPARRLDLADRGDHARPRDRLAGAGAAGRGAVLEGRGRRPAVRARPEDRRRLARALGALRRRGRARGCATSSCSTSARRANLLTFLREQADATGAVPTDRTIVVERFRDEIGDWRVCILSPFGGRVHAPWAMAIDRAAARVARRRGAVDLVGRRDRAALPRRRRAAAVGRPAARARTRSRISSSRSSATRRSSARASARTPRARC